MTQTHPGCIWQPPFPMVFISSCVSELYEVIFLCMKHVQEALPGYWEVQYRIWIQRYLAYLSHPLIQICLLTWLLKYVIKSLQTSDSCFLIIRPFRLIVFIFRSGAGWHDECLRCFPNLELPVCCSKAWHLWAFKAGILVWIVCNHVILLKLVKWAIFTYSRSPWSPL